VVIVLPSLSISSSAAVHQAAKGDRSPFIAAIRVAVVVVVAVVLRVKVHDGRCFQ